ncbi:NADH dehydrogenase [Luteimicrobium album]|uniref:NADH dehydrogenase n=1 Tax=Luteimicrobium album TaxID=1054550 RepID=A0ABQ6I9V3_9MICO|nr:FAD-dependent oxidoreductase [Luteimicrobium album]GMA26479.1 NADH dehydrogenase [Luteimicrobium album]
MTDKTQVVVLGGGYAGVMAADRLTQRDDLAVTLVNPRGTFVERIRLHQLVAGTDDAVVEYRDVLAEDVRLAVDSAARIDVTGRRVELASGGALAYDYLVYAVGSGSAEPDLPGAAERAYPIAGLEQAERLRAALDGFAGSARVTVIGAGPSGIETAAELAEAGRAVTLVCGSVLGPYLHARGRRAVARRLARLGVEVLAGPGATATAVTRDAVLLADGRELASDVTVRTVGFSVPDLARRSGLSTDDAGRVLTDETLTSVDDPRIVAAGDAAAPSGVPFRMSCQAAGPLGCHAADTVLHRVAGTEPEPVALGFFGQCLSLGRRAGVFQVSHRDDAATAWYVGGPAGGRLKEYICASIVKQLRDEARRPGSHRWAGDRTRTERLRARRDDVAAASGQAR